MFSYFPKKRNQKELYYQLAAEFKKANDGENKTRGVYAIFKNDVCLYVGQSKNISSRLATHLSGKYKECDKILIYESVEDDTFDLVPTEKYAIQHFKPIENLLADYSEKIKMEDIFEGSIYYEIENPHKNKIDLLGCADYTLINDKYDLFFSFDIGCDLYHSNKVTDYFKSLISNIEKTKESKWVLK